MAVEVTLGHQGLVSMALHTIQYTRNPRFGIIFSPQNHSSFHIGNNVGGCGSMEVRP
jgi:hypothetical protein